MLSGLYSYAKAVSEVSLRRKREGKSGESGRRESGRRRNRHPFFVSRGHHTLGNFFSRATITICKANPPYPHLLADDYHLYLGTSDRLWHTSPSSILELFTGDGEFILELFKPRRSRVTRICKLTVIQGERLPKLQVTRSGCGREAGGRDAGGRDAGGMPSQGARTPEMREVHYGDLDGKLQSSNSRYGG
jgi:hypothetical protein